MVNDMREPRLIDAFSLSDEVFESKKDNPHSDGIVRRTHDHEHDRFLCMIALAPTVDAVPVVHGRWEFDGSDFADIWKCTACGDDWFFEYDPRDNETRVNYCPNCGARMDGGSND